MYTFYTTFKQHRITELALEAKAGLGASIKLMGKSRWMFSTRANQAQLATDKSVAVKPTCS